VLISSDVFAHGKTCHDATLESTVGMSEEFGSDAKCNPLTTTDFSSFFITSVAEFPGILFTIFIIDRAGRKKAMAFELVVVGIFTMLCVLCVPEGLQTFFLFVARGMISGAFQAVYVYLFLLCLYSILV
jgi:MFS family permease